MLDVEGMNEFMVTYVCAIEALPIAPEALP